VSLKKEDEDDEAEKRGRPTIHYSLIHPASNIAAKKKSGRFE